MHNIYSDKHTDDKLSERATNKASSTSKKTLQTTPPETSPESPQSTQHINTHKGQNMNELGEARVVWANIQSDLRSLLGENAHRSWTARLCLHSADEHYVRLMGPSPFVTSRIINDYGDKIQSLWATQDSRHILIGVAADFNVVTQQALARRESAQPANHMPDTLPHTLSGAPANHMQDEAGSNITTQDGHIVSLQTPHQSKPASSNAGQSNTGPSKTGHKQAKPHQTKSDQGFERFTFDNFVIGPTNELAHAVARKVVSSRNCQYNPIVIHGPHGMGKTHLMHAVKNQIERDDPSRRVHLISAEQFVASFVNALRAGTRSDLDAFKRSLREVDLLIIDDAHFIADKPSSQEELLHTLISLVGANKQVLLATDRHPHAINKAGDRLKSYLCAGLLCDIGPADYELRRRILDRLIERKRKSGNPQLAMPEQARDHLAARINATPRDLEGAFNQVVARSEFLGRELTLESVQEALSHSRYNNGRRPTVDRIQKAACKQFGITMDDMLSKRRARAIARPRQAAMYLAKTLTTRSLPDIGRRFGGRDHTTVIHAVKRIEALRAEDPQLSANIEAVIETLKS